LHGAPVEEYCTRLLPAPAVAQSDGSIRMPTQSKWQGLPTEAINPVSLAVDKLPVRDIIEMVVNEDRKVISAVLKEKERIAHGVEIITQALRKGGRIIFVGAGTSGRLGVVEASEMPPTFGTPPNVVQAIMAGGQEAVFRAKEGVEDNYEEGARSIARLRLGRKDVVVGVSASGMTPFVRGGLTRARKAGAKIIFVTCWPGSELQNFVDLQIAPAVGPEIIAGSTRLKAGTATKMVLNMLTTISMIKVGKTYGNLMVDVRTGSEKLKDRARRIIGVVTGLDYDEADALLRRAKWNVKAAIVMQKAELTLPQALKRLRKADDSIREAIGEDIEDRLRQLLSRSESPTRTV
jgi:N-acetylmuramic acid 6-phosphate etherase